MNDHYEFKIQPLPYDYDSLEPFIDAKTMEIHHNRHLKTYVDNLNGILENCPKLQDLSLRELICNSNIYPYSLRTSIHNNAGGIFNHEFFFDGMQPVSSRVGSARKQLTGISAAIDMKFGNYEDFLKEFKAKALSVFGSGYAWLAMNRCKKLDIITTANQDTPLTQNLIPLIAVDVWEHAYYLKHLNKRAAYFDDWVNVINWNKAEELYVAPIR